jgi:predicted nucleic acid-binding Zn ribbon protein
LERAGEDGFCGTRNKVAQRTGRSKRRRLELYLVVALVVVAAAVGLFIALR